MAEEQKKILEVKLMDCKILLRSLLATAKDGIPFHLIASEQLFQS